MSKRLARAVGHVHGQRVQAVAGAPPEAEVTGRLQQSQRVASFNLGTDVLAAAACATKEISEYPDFEIVRCRLHSSPMGTEIQRRKAART